MTIRDKEEERNQHHYVSDCEARELIRHLCGHSNIYEIQILQRKERNEILESIIRCGVGVRQLARLTGVSYGIIQRINEKVGQRTVPIPTATQMGKVYRRLIVE